MNGFGFWKLDVFETIPIACLSGAKDRSFYKDLVFTTVSPLVLVVGCVALSFLRLGWKRRGAGSDKGDGFSPFSREAPVISRVYSCHSEFPLISSGTGRSSLVSSSLEESGPFPCDMLIAQLTKVK